MVQLCQGIFKGLEPLVQNLGGLLCSRNSVEPVKNIQKAFGICKFWTVEWGCMFGGVIGILELINVDVIRLDSHN